MRKVFTLSLFAVAVGVVAGCTGPSGENFSGETVPVKGKATFADGTPAAGVGFVFSAPGVEGQGAVAKDGTVAPRFAGKDGLPAGKYKVYVDVEPPGKKVPAKYTSAETSGIEIEVSAGNPTFAVSLK